MASDRIKIHDDGSVYTEVVDKLPDGSFVKVRKMVFGGDDVATSVSAENPLPVTLDATPTTGVNYYVATVTSSTAAATTTDLDVQDGANLGRVGSEIVFENTGSVGLDISVSANGTDFPDYITVAAGETVELASIDVHTVRYRTASDGDAATARIIAL